MKRVPRAQEPGAEPEWAVYMLRCSDGSLYTGATNDLSRRLVQHRCGKGAAYTRSRLPVVLVFKEPATGKASALRREAALKRLSRAEKLVLLRKQPAGERSPPAPPGAASGGRGQG
jgi:putative endonuclease